MSIDHTKLTSDELFELARTLPKQSELMSIAEAANALGFSVRSLRRWEAAGRMPRRFKRSRCWAYRRCDIETLRHNRSTKTLSRQAPLPSMLIAMPLLASTPVNAEPVNCEP